MTPDERYERKVEAVYIAITDDEHAKVVLRKEAARLNLTLDEMLQPTKARQLIDDQESPALDGLMHYFANKEPKLQ